MYIIILLNELKQIKMHTRSFKGCEWSLKPNLEDQSNSHQHLRIQFHTHDSCLVWSWRFPKCHIVWDSTIDIALHLSTLYPHYLPQFSKYWKHLDFFKTLFCSKEYLQNYPTNFNMSNSKRTQQRFIDHHRSHPSPGDWGVEELKHMYHLQDPKSRRKAWCGTARGLGWVEWTSPDISS